MVLLGIQLEIQDGQLPSEIECSPAVLANKRKRGQKNSKAVKKPKKGEIHDLPFPPEGQSAITTEENRKAMLLEMQSVIHTCSSWMD